MKKLLPLTISILFTLLLPTVAHSQAIKFNKTYGQMPYNYGKRIIQANDEGYFILANENGNIANTNIHIIRTDSLGIILYEKTIGDASIYSANDFIRTSDNGFLITGLTNKHSQSGYDVLLVKTDSNANVLWEKTYGGTDWDIGNAVIETPDDAYLVAGQTYSYGPGQGNIYVIKTNLSGDTLWTRVFGGDSTDYAMSADNKLDSTYLIGATTNSFGHGNFDGYVLNLKPNGDTLWTQTYGEDKEDIIYSIKQTPDSGFVFVGSTMSYNAIEHESWLMKYNRNKILEWKMPEDWEIGWADDVNYSVSIGDSGRYLLTGFTTGAGNGGKELSFLVIGDYHEFICSHTDGSTDDEIGTYAIKTRDGGYIIIGTSDGLGNGISNIYVVKIAGDCSYSLTTENITDVKEETNPDHSFFGIYPSINEGLFFVKLSDNSFSGKYSVHISDLMGKTVYSQIIDQHDAFGNLVDISHEASGLYFVTVYNDHDFACLKIIKQ